MKEPATVCDHRAGRNAERDYGWPEPVRDVPPQLASWSCIFAFCLAPRIRLRSCHPHVELRAGIRPRESRAPPVGEQLTDYHVSNPCNPAAGSCVNARTCCTDDVHSTGRRDTRGSRLRSKFGRDTRCSRSRSKSGRRAARGRRSERPVRVGHESPPARSARTLCCRARRST